MKYVKKPVIVEAFKLGVDHIPDWFMDRVTDGSVILLRDREIDSLFDHDHKTMCEIITPEGIMKAEHGDYVIKGTKGEIYPCKPDIFVTIYDKVE